MTKLPEFFLGIGLGLGYLTSFRFSYKIGVSEILILCSTLFLFKRYGTNFFSFSKDHKGFLKLYFFFVFLFQLPFFSSINYLNSGHFFIVLYSFSFFLAFFLTFLLVNGLRKKEIDMELVTILFFYSFLFTNFLIFYFSDFKLGIGRYQGGANNPNQLLFYSSSLSLLLVMYKKKLALIGLPVITLIMFKTGSDAYFLTFTISVFFIFLYFFIYSNNFSIGLRSIIFSFVFLILIFFALFFYQEEIINIWFDSDQGNGRTFLMSKSVSGVLESPLFGWGIGGFMEVSNSHSTPIDFALRFGLGFSFLIYLTMFLFVLKKLKRREVFQAAFATAYISSGLFHFSGRHFDFWVIFAVFYYHVFYKDQNENISIKPA